MITLEGKEFFSFEIVYVVEAIKTALWADYWNNFEGGTSEESARLLTRATALLVETNKKVDVDSASSDPPVYQQGTPFWGKVNNLVKDASKIPAVEGVVAQGVATLPAGDPKYSKGTTAMMTWGITAGMALIGGLLIFRKKT